MTASQEEYSHIVHETEVDGGWSGRLRIVVGTNRADQDPLVFVDSDLLGPRRLVLTPEEAEGVGSAITSASVKAERSVSADPLAPKVRHQWDVEVALEHAEAPLTLWRNGHYIAHLDQLGAEALASQLRMRAESLSADRATL